VEIVNATDELCEIVPQRDEIVLSWDDRCEVVREVDDPAGTYLTHTWAGSPQRLTCPRRLKRG